MILELEIKNEEMEEQLATVVGLRQH